MKLFTATLATLLAPILVVHAKPTHQFDHFFPGWNDRVQAILRDNCSEPYAEYLTGDIKEKGEAQALVNPVIDCVLGVFPESRKAELATGALILGLIPTILQSIGSSTTETALVGLRRPLLGFLISAGSPAVSMMKTGDFARSIMEFVEGGGPRELSIDTLRWSRGRAKWAVLIALLEYVVVGGAVANVLHLAWQLGVNAVAIFAPDTIFGVPVWTLGASLIHLTGCLALWVRVRMQLVDGRNGEDYSARTKPLNTWVPTQLIPAVFHPAMTLELRRDGGSTFWFYVLSWIISFGILAQVAFGTLVLSGLLFFSLVDCLIIVGRYTLSAIVCRAVVRLELSGMMAAMVPVKGNEAVESEQIVLTGWKRQPAEM
ncbi:hypothetical protein E0Z10_g7908 [Xylaria hypoxylon]|uniref:Uncharacterized protein n=1 Tax=Xylaria hypoxylon TaxID=37992 RepID=A0A4Z0Y9K6_9PEZI|nr:hypothetical protein E0Z10_g7908 [Xylaria hypoxylon]